jgi:hypothetical protein
VEKPFVAKADLPYVVLQEADWRPAAFGLPIEKILCGKVKRA